ncbi:MAG: 4Fe-4S binding protein [Eubacteriales bacterium]|nr:4Fe-4S binding protein [Eubacteriales bacterium]
MAHVTFDTQRCKGCALCVNVCPKKILTLDKGTLNSKGYYPARCIDEEKCIGCANCARMCPDVCIVVER